MSASSSASPEPDTIDDFDDSIASSVNASDRPRVRTDGPGGDEVKRGARIACLECRSAKIRCSAPNDGQVPCKRCARHDKECVFEKHRRGRKPGRGNLPKEKPFPKEDPSQRPLDRHPRFHEGGYQSSSSAAPWSPSLASPSYGPAHHGSMASPSGYAPSPSRYSGKVDYYGGSRPPPPPPSQQQHHAGPQPQSHPQSQADSRPNYLHQHGPPPQHQRQASQPGQIPFFPRREHSGSFGSSNRALPSPRDVYYNSGPLSAGNSNLGPQGYFAAPQSRQQDAASPPSYSGHSSRDGYNWGPGASNGAAQHQQQPQPYYNRAHDNWRHPHPTDPPPPQNKYARIDQMQHARQAQDDPNGDYRSSDEGETEEPVVEDELVEAYQDADVLSRPLQLLAYASTAAARKQQTGGFRDPRSRVAAATLGLISKPAAPQPEQAIPQPTAAKLSASTIAPPRPSSAVSSEAGTLENGNWEYKAGRVQAVKGGDMLSPDTGSKGSENIASVTAMPPRDINDPVPADSGLHLGKRRRSDDELLPVPATRRPSRAEAIMPVIKQNLLKETFKDDLKEEDAAEGVIASGASRKGYFRFSLYSAKLDIDDAFDPIDLGILTKKEMEDLFDVFFNQINPANFIFDPFLHSLGYIRIRSKFLLTVIASHAARVSEGARSAELAERLEEHWRVKLLPEIVTGGYKSVEISQAFLVASLFHRPTHVIVEDRAWQFLGLAIRTATEVGVNISLAPKLKTHDDEHLSRRLRNRERLWLCLIIAEGTLSTQFGRPCTLNAQESAHPQSQYWHREDYALPEDAAVVSQIELRKIVERHTRACERCTSTFYQARADESAPLEQLEVTKLQQLAKQQKLAWRELEKWKSTWCPTGDIDAWGLGGSMAMGAFLRRWSPYARLNYHYWRSHLNSFILEADTKKEEYTSMAAFDSLNSARKLAEILLDEQQIGHRGLAVAPNAVVVMSVYASVSALRLMKLDFSRHALIDTREIFEQVNKLADALESAGHTPPHRDGAAGPYGLYLRSILGLYDSDSKSSSSVTSSALEPRDLSGDLTDPRRPLSGSGAAVGEGKNATLALEKALNDSASFGVEGDSLARALVETAAEADAIMADSSTSSSNGGKGDKAASRLSGSALDQVASALAASGVASPISRSTSVASGAPNIAPATRSTSAMTPNQTQVHAAAAAAASTAGAPQGAGNAMPNPLSMYATDQEVWDYLSGDATASIWPIPSTNWGGGL